jgi:Protein of unknown function (DUF4232)
MTSFPRHLRRMIAAAALGGIAAASAACSSSAGQAVQPAAKASVAATASPTASRAAAGSPTASASTSESPPPSPSGPAPCPSSGLQVTLGQGNGAAGSTYYPLDFSNNSGASCTLFGYPGVSFVTGIGGSQIGSAASRNPALPSELITIPPGGVAHATLQVVNAENFAASACHMVTAHWLKVYPPNQTAPLYVSFSAHACSGKAKPVNILAVEAVRPGSS